MPVRAIRPEEREAVLQLDGPARLRHFVKKVVAMEEAWGLWDEGWAMMAGDEGTDVLPLWPAREYAELHADGSWSGYAPRRVSLDDLLERLAEAGAHVSVFPTAAAQGVIPAPSELRWALERECVGHL